MNLETTKLTRRYTKTDIKELNTAEIKAQNVLCGFDYLNKKHPITRVFDADSIYYMQGRGKVKIAEPVLRDQGPVERQGYRHD